MKNPAVLTAVAAVLVAIGFVAGVVVGQRRTVEVERTRQAIAPTVDRVNVADRPPAASSVVEADVEKLRRRITELEFDLRRVREESGPQAPAADPVETARLAYESLLAMETGAGKDPEQLRSLILRLSKVEAPLAKHFAQRFRDLRGEGADASKLNVAIQLALMAGGPDAADFVQQLLTDGSLDAGVRRQLVSELASGGGSLFSIRRLPVGDALGSTAMTLTRSTDADDRRAGAGLLGGVSTPAARTELARLLAADTDSNVRQSAAGSLGLVGDSSSRKLLETYAAQTQDLWLQKAAAAALAELDRSPR